MGKNLKVSLIQNETIKNLVMDLERRVQENILEPNNLEFIKKLLNKAESEDEAITICKLGTTFYKTGLVFDKKLEVGTDGLRVFDKNNTLSLGINSNNKLIISDNYDALLNLQVSHRDKIDVIYIDPPYGANDMGEFAQTNYHNQINRDNLLSMLLPRLFLAKNLLTDNGFIFCSIDDKNQAYIKCLFDDVFGERNFIETFINRSNPRGNQAKKFTASEHEYILCYAKNKDEIFPLGFNKEEVDFVNSDEKGSYAATGLRKRGAGSTRAEAPNQYYPIYYNPSTNTITIEKKTGYVEILPKLSNGEDGRWRWAK
jgi:adenine-specific DNA-methyltransferase